MLTKVEVVNSSGVTLTLMLEEVTNGLYIENIDGLEPVKATLISSSFAQQDGAQYHTSKRETRNILMKIGMEPDWATQTVKDLRNRIYRFFMPKTEITMLYYDSDESVVSIVGRVESCEPPIFSRDPEVDISIVCFSPDFLSTTDEELVSETVNDSDETTIDYDGTVETGVVFTLNVDRTLSEFTIYNTPPDGIVQSMDFSADLLTGDQVVISTLEGNKYVNLIRDFTQSSLLYALAQSNWIELKPGENRIRFYATGAAIPFTMTYTNTYGGL